MLRKIRGVLCGVAVVGVSAVASTASAQATGLTYDFSSAETSLQSGLTSPITIGLGIGVAVFIILYGWRLLKRTAK